MHRRVKAALRLAALAVVGMWVPALAASGAQGSSSSVYVANGVTDGAGGISEYDVGSGGALAPKSAASVAGGDAPDAIAVSPDGKSVYVVNNSTDGVGGVSQYDVGAGGTLTPKATPAVAAGKLTGCDCCQPRRQERLRRQLQ